MNFCIVEERYDQILQYRFQLEQFFILGEYTKKQSRRLFLFGKDSIEVQMTFTDSGLRLTQICTVIF